MKTIIEETILWLKEVRSKVDTNSWELYIPNIEIDAYIRNLKASRWYANETDAQLRAIYIGSRTFSVPHEKLEERKRGIYRRYHNRAETVDFLIDFLSSLGYASAEPDHEDLLTSGLFFDGFSTLYYTDEFLQLDFFKQKFLILNYLAYYVLGFYFSSPYGYSETNRKVYAGYVGALFSHLEISSQSLSISRNDKNTAYDIYKDDPDVYLILPRESLLDYFYRRIMLTDATPNETVTSSIVPSRSLNMTLLNIEYHPYIFSPQLLKWNGISPTTSPETRKVYLEHKDDDYDIVSPSKKISTEHRNAVTILSLFEDL